MMLICQECQHSLEDHHVKTDEKDPQVGTIALLVCSLCLCQKKVELRIMSE